ncbi:hypothetical protein ASF22_20270 [Methylobacterium sp. Leaf87]|uniref:hypothetical protein n=1 Tax=Methylobacterium sp. Leaf87 TaxID=1736243 RepID=UPI0006FF4AB8|nr:hypothetical protein [Methylobacterium sp. Leaf87]KQO66653.1 hypothetical protein ASF22_20270 [Methylobacterium sp. Leaf87]
MPILELRRLPRSVAAQAAIVGTTRAMETAFPIIRDEAVRNRIGRALAALFAAEALAGRV